MAQVLSLKELRSSSALKADITKLEEDMARLNDQLERQKLLEKKLREDLLDQKKDYEHLEKQFEHFAGIEAEFEAMQQEVQLERLEKLIDGDKKDSQLKTLVKKSRDELKEAQDELRELKQMDPVRLKRQVADLKKKTLEQATDNQNVNKALVGVRKDLKEVTTEKESFEAQLKATNTAADFFWQSVDSVWTLHETAIVLKDEKVEDEDKFKRIRCQNMQTGVSVLSNGRDDSDKALWLGEVAIPDDVSEAAGKRLLSIIAALEDDAG